MTGEEIPSENVDNLLLYVINHKNPEEIALKIFKKPYGWEGDYAKLVDIKKVKQISVETGPQKAFFLFHKEGSGCLATRLKDGTMVKALGEGDGGCGISSSENDGVMVTM